ncbi:glycerol kinase GlpK [Flavobacterium oreochromis]|uniref:Glycerol kinase n=1 Tax=Flavobacterium oreochromis TaxID=2906078 RepID=A0ABW8P8R3_9FLAO|nr:glycerol kinase GlpK [Flavobacterium oreochromis]OWP77764.1 glycerol kinase [Flavobacterium oreochromis]POR21378.1 glycerol kinase [Flavobacterium columnare]QYS85754.1 glycerol kinase GlpK [Flavobacterium oreochromis]
MSKYILSLDQGTTSSRSILFDLQGNVVAVSQKEFSQIFPIPGWVEHDPIEIWESQLSTIFQVLEKAQIKTSEIKAIGITNQRETTVLWDKKTGKPIYNAIVWQDRRTAVLCDDLKSRGLNNIIQQKTGLVVDSYFSGTKVKWILDHVQDARKMAEQNEILFGTIDSWLLWNLTQGKVHATDVSNASRTLLCNIHNCEWDEELLEILNVPMNILPEICSSSEIYGYTNVLDPDINIPIAGIAGDQQAALFGQMCIQPGMVKNTYGTGCFMLMNTGEELIPSQNHLLTTVAWKINGITHYALEGSVFIAGAVVQWLRDGLGIIQSSEEIETLAATVETNEGVYVVPAFAGLGAPYWNQHARGTITGLTRGTTAGHIARASLESIAYQTRDVLLAMQADSHIYIKELRVDGGATVNNLLMQFQADVLNTKVIRPIITETTALGAAYLAGLAVGFWKNIDELQQQWQVEKIFTSTIEPEIRNTLNEGWKKAISASEAFI